MRVQGADYQTIWMKGNSVLMINQNLLPFEFHIFEAKDCTNTCQAIKKMIVRGAGAIGAAAACAMVQGFAEAPADNYWQSVERSKRQIESTRPTAQNLFYAIDRVYQAAKHSAADPVLAARQEAEVIIKEDIQQCRTIGTYGETLIKEGANILTHCNAGWLAFVDYGTALAPIYTAWERKKKIFVYMDETRPRGQGAKLTAWELKNEDIPCAIIPDNAAAHFMSLGKIDLVIVGADRIAANGDTANKIGTLEKAICARAYGIPFYVAAPTSTFDMACASGIKIPIEERSEEEVLFQTGLSKEGTVEKVQVSAPGSKAINPAFDVTPAKYISGIITEKGIIEPKHAAIKKLFE